jgi:putative transposase
MTTPDPETQKALWRYGVISPLLHRSDDDPALVQMIAKLADKRFIRADGTAVSLSAETIRKWLYRYRAGGLDALADRTRSDKGKHNVPKAVAEALPGLREAHPNWTAAKMLERLLADGHWNGITPSRASLYRFIDAHGLKRSPSQAPPAARRPFAFDCFGQMWMADFMHGPRLREARSFKKAILHAIMDDASRYVVCASFGWQENVEVMLTELMRAVSRFGICQRFYTDNGPCYASSHLKQVCARLGIQLVHTPPYRPQGRGKLERFFRTIRDQFLSDLRADTLQRLNADLNEYLAQYHQRPHGGLGQSPLQKRLAGENACRPLPEVADIRHLFAATRRCRVYNDNTIRLNGRVFEVPDALPGSRVEVCYLPWEDNWVFYGHDFKPARLLDKTANAYRFNHPKGGLQ